MAFNPFSGSSAAFYAVNIPLTAGSDLIVYGAQVPVVISEFNKYDFQFQLASTAEFVGFNSDADANSRALFYDQLAGGTLKWSVTLGGAESSDAVGTNSYTRFYPGQFLRFHLIKDRSTGFGFRNLMGKVLSYSGGADVSANEPQPLRLEIRGTSFLYPPNIT